MSSAFQTRSHEPEGDLVRPYDAANDYDVDADDDDDDDDDCEDVS